MKKIRILFIIDNLLHFGGAQTQFALLAKNLDKNIFEINVCNLHSGSDTLVKELEKSSVKVFTIPQAGFFDVPCLLKLISLIRALRPDIVNTFLYTAEFYGRLAAALGEKTIIIDSVRNIDLWKKRRNVLADRILNRHTRHFTANCYAVKEYLLKKYNLKEEKVSVIYNGIWPQGPVNEGPPLPDIPGIGTEKKVILTIARFSRQKDLGTLVEAAKLILKKRSDVVFLLIGQGETRKEIQGQIINSGFKDHFILWEDTKQPRSFYKIAYLGLLTSLYEGLSNFILEAMACGLPVIATRVGGNPELVVDGQTGFLIPEQDPGRAAEKTLFLLDNPQVAREFGRQAKKRAEENFSAAAMVDQYQDLYRKLYSNGHL